MLPKGASIIPYPMNGAPDTAVASYHVKFMKYTSSRIATNVNQAQVNESNKGPVDLCIVAHPCGFQVYSLERDAMEILRLVRIVRNTFAPINRLPPEVFSLILDHYDESDADQILITLTHVCHGWRDTFLSHSSLWTQLNFAKIDKTCTYIQRSQSSPLIFNLDLEGKTCDDAFALAIPHIQRLKSLTIRADTVPSVLAHFHRHMPLLEKLDLKIRIPAREGQGMVDQDLDVGISAGDLSSLHELRLEGVITHFHWKNLANLRVIKLDSELHKYGTTQILDLLESTPLLHTFYLSHFIPSSPNPAPEPNTPSAKRIIPLPHLKSFVTSTSSSHPLLLHRHLRIPIGASVICKLSVCGEEFPLLVHLPQLSPNFSNLSPITTINTTSDGDRKVVQLCGPNGCLRLIAEWDIQVTPANMYCKILRSIDHSTLSKIHRLMISDYNHQTPAKIEECPVFQTLSLTNNLRTLVLSNCDNLPFILALDPQRNPSNLIPCLKLEELILHISSDYLNPPPAQSVFSMAKNRASRGAKLTSITLVDREWWSREKVPKLEEYVTHVEFGFPKDTPDWDEIPGESVRVGQSCSGPL